MLSTFPAITPSDGFFGNQFPVFEGGFTPWDSQEPLFPFQNHESVISPNKPQEPVLSNSCSDDSNPKTVTSNSGSDEPGPVVDERKRRRMVSNRESARRSRMRKQKHLENLRNQVNRLRFGKRELTNRLALVTHHCQLVRRENDRLKSESNMLGQKLWALHQVLLVREIQQSINQQNQPSLIT